MLAGIDPFSDEDPMLIYQKILKGKVKFPRSFDKNAKSLVKHILQADLSKRYGNLKRGVKDIKNHQFSITQFSEGSLHFEGKNISIFQVGPSI